MIIGEKTIFAVEFYALLDTIPPFGQICYWVAGETYGDIEFISTLGLLFGGLNTEKQNTKLFLKKNIQQEGLDKKDYDDISVDSCHVFLLQDVQKNTWIIAEDFEEQRFCCIDVNLDDIQNVFCELSINIQNLLERYYK